MPKDIDKYFIFKWSFHRDDITPNDLKKFFHKFQVAVYTSFAQAKIVDIEHASDDEMSYVVKIPIAEYAYRTFSALEEELTQLCNDYLGCWTFEEEDNIKGIKRTVKWEI